MFPAFVGIGLGTAIGGLVGGIGSLVGGERANRQRMAAAREQMRFQERMSSTAYQRAVEDMRKAGINPILAYQQGGASSPGGALPAVDDVISPAISSAKQGLMARAELRNLRQIGNRTAQEVKTGEAQEANLRQQAALAHSMFYTDGLRQAWIEAQTEGQKWDNAIKSVQKDIAEINKQHMSLATPGLRNQAWLQQSAAGKPLAALGGLRSSGALGALGMLGLGILNPIGWVSRMGARGVANKVLGKRPRGFEQFPGR